MGFEDEEKMPLVVDAATEAKKMAGSGDVAVALPSADQERTWDGHLLQVCGNCDHAGLASFAIVKMFSPCAWGHNMKRAFGASFWKHAVIFALLFGFWTYVYIGAASHYGAVCAPHPPHHPHHPKQPADPLSRVDPKILPGLQGDPEQQVFLTGATLNTDLIPEEDVIKPVQGDDGQTSGFTVIVDGEPTDLNAFEEVNSQVQNAKNQAMEGMNQLNTQLLGRKLQHKHHDDEEEHDEGKQAKKDKKKKCKKNKKHHDDDDDDDDHHHHHGTEWVKPEVFEYLDKAGFEEPFPHWHPHPDPMSEEEQARACKDALTNVVGMWVILAVSLVVGTVYAARMRTAFRERYGIKGSKCKDCMAWAWCAPCALCQETRTIMNNNVHDGKWFGPTVLASPVPQDPFKAPHQVKAPTIPEAGSV